MKETRSPFPFTGENIYAPNEASLVPDLKFRIELTFIFSLNSFMQFIMHI